MFYARKLLWVAIAALVVCSIMVSAVSAADFRVLVTDSRYPWAYTKVAAYDGVTGAYLSEWGLGGEIPSQITVSNGIAYISRLWDQQLSRYNVNTGAKIDDLLSSPLYANASAIGPDGKLYYVTFGAESGVKIYNPATGAHEGMFVTLDGTPYDLAWTKAANGDDRLLVVAHTAVMVYEYNTLGQLITSYGTDYYPYGIAVGNGCFYINHDNGNIIRWNTQTHTADSWVTGFTKGRGTALGPDGLLYVAYGTLTNASTNGAGCVRRFNAETGAAIDTFAYGNGDGGQLFDPQDVTFVPPISMPVISYSDDVTVDANLADWAEEDFIDETFAYFPAAGLIDSDMTNPQVAFKWGAGGTKVYMAARVQDSHHFFIDTYTAWNASDRIEAQIWASSQSGIIDLATEDKAQQYEIALKANGVDSWCGIIGGSTVPDFAGFQYSVKTGADGWIYYEAAMTPFEAFNLLTGATTPRILVAGDVIGADACLASMNGTGQYNQVAINDKQAKYYYTTSLYQWELVRTGVQGTIDLLNYTADIFGQAGTVTITDGVSTETHKIVIDTNGLFTFTTALRGACTATAKVGHWLAKSEAVTVDVDGNGTVNFSLLNGDINGDGAVGGTDLFQLRSNWGKTVSEASNPNADLNGDGTIGGSDLFILRTNWGKSDQ